MTFLLPIAPPHRHRHPLPPPSPRMPLSDLMQMEKERDESETAREVNDTRQLQTSSDSLGSLGEEPAPLGLGPGVTSLMWRHTSRGRRPSQQQEERHIKLSLYQRLQLKASLRCFIKVNSRKPGLKAAAGRDPSVRQRTRRLLLHTRLKAAASNSPGSGSEVEPQTDRMLSLQGQKRLLCVIHHILPDRKSSVGALKKKLLEECVFSYALC